MVKSTKFSHHNIYKYTWTSPGAITHSQIVHVTLIITSWSQPNERLSLKKGIKQHFVADRYNLNKLLDHETIKEYQIDVDNSVQPWKI